MKPKHKMSSIHDDKANSQMELPSPSPSNPTMTATPEPQLTNKDPEESILPKPNETSCAAKDSGKEESKSESNSASQISDDENADNASGSKDNAKRFLPAYKKANAALTFPEKVSNFNGGCAHR